MKIKSAETKLPGPSHRVAAVFDEVRPAGLPVPPLKSLREFIRDALLDRIARGDLTEGQRVVEATLVAEFGISATPVREAIRELVAMGVLDAHNNKGAFIRQINWMKPSKRSK